MVSVVVVVASREYYGMVVAKNGPIYIFMLNSDDEHVCEGILRFYEQVSKRADRC